MDKTYIAIDLKSFYASQECISRGLDPMCTNLVVADNSRTQKTICLAVSPALKAIGVPGRARLFEVIEKVKQANAMRLSQAPGHRFTGSSWDANALSQDPTLSIDYLIASPRMAEYIRCSTQIYDIYLKYVAPEDIHVYSIDEVFIDATSYLSLYRTNAKELVRTILCDVFDTTGITATAGIGPNLYLCKIAMDIVAKHAEADENGARIAELTERSYREKLWGHRPLTDFWRVGRGYQKKLEAHGIFTMGDIARCSLENEDFLYKLFGINAELLIDHAWGWEPCTIAEIKSYRPSVNSLSSGQVLHMPYDFQKAKLVVREMADALALDLVEKNLVTNQIVLTVGYDIENLKDQEIRNTYHGEITIDPYGRSVPKHAHGTENLECKTSSSKLILDAVTRLFQRIVNPNLLVRRMYVVAGRVYPADSVTEKGLCAQLDFFGNFDAQQKEQQKREREKRQQQAVLRIKKKYGKNAIVKGMNLLEGATAMERNRQIGGHKA